MNKKLNIVLFLFCLISLIRTTIIIINDKNFYLEEQKSIVGVITNITKDDDKVVIDVKQKDKYRITKYENINFELGDRVRVKGVFSTPTNNTVFNLFNYRKYLLSKNITMVSYDANLNLISKNNNVLYRLKNSVINHVEKYESSNYLKAFILADTSEISNDVKESYNMIGISHLLAISGMHVGVFLYILNLFLKKYKFKNVVIILFLLFFLFLTGFPESLLRCVTFFILSLINKKFKLNVSDIKLIIFCCCLLLLLNPYLVYSVGFLFSFTITFFILLARPYLKHKNYFKKIFVMSLICFFASLPILANYFFKINFLSPFLNVLFIPLVSIIVFPFSLITFFIPFLDGFYVTIIKFFEFICGLISKIDVLSFSIAKPNVVMILIYYVSLYLTIKANKKWIVLFLMILIINLNMRFLIINPSLTFIDVGQGDSTIIILPRGKTILIDTGGKYMSNYSIAKNKIIPYLNSVGINKINTLILTHGDYDHMGEAINLINNIKVEKVILNNDEYNDLELSLIKQLDKKHIPYYKEVSKLNIGKNKLYFLNDKIHDDENDNSIVAYLQLKDVKILLMGDAGLKVEEEILKKYNVKDVDVLKVGHHGSKTSSGKTFINNVNPKYGIISVGKNNRYGHPNKEALDNLKNSTIYRTDIDGSIIFKIKYKKIKIHTCPP